LLRRLADASLRKRNDLLRRRVIALKFAAVRAVERAERAEALLREARDGA
jgi:hypothetical protein